MSFTRALSSRYPPPPQQPPRDSYNAPPYMPKNDMPPIHRRYEDVAPPGTEQPPVPGMEPSPPQQDEKYQYPSPSREKDTVRHEKERHHRYVTKKQKKLPTGEDKQ